MTDKSETKRLNANDDGPDTLQPVFSSKSYEECKKDVSARGPQGEMVACKEEKRSQQDANDPPGPTASSRNGSESSSFRLPDYPASTSIPIRSRQALMHAQSHMILRKVAYHLFLTVGVLGWMLYPVAGCSTSDTPPCLRMGLLSDYPDDLTVFMRAIDDWNRRHNETESSPVVRFEGVHEMSSRDAFPAIVNTQTLVKEHNVFCVLGAPTSPLSAAIQGYLSTQDRLQMSYLSTSPLLSDTDLYPTFSRVVASDEYQAHAMIAFCQQYGWEEIAVLYGDSVYGIGGYESLAKAAEQARIAIPSRIRLSSSSDGLMVGDEPVREALVQLRKSKLRIVVSFLFQSEAMKVFRMAQELSMLDSDTVWIVSDSVVGEFNSRQRTVLESFLQDHPSIGHGLARNLVGFYPSSTASDQGNAISTSTSPYLVDAVTSVAQAAVNVLTQSNTSISAVFSAREYMLDALKELEFEGVTGHVGFDTNADRAISPGYEISQFEPSTGWTMQTIGKYSSTQEQNLLHLHAPLQWGLQTSNVAPSSRPNPLDCSTCRPRDNITFAFLAHGNLDGNDPFWERIQRGTREAAGELGLSIQNIMIKGAGNNHTKVLEYFEEILSSKTTSANIPDFIVTSQPDQALLKKQLELASSFGVPVITINTNEDMEWASDTTKPLAHVGMNNTLAGEMAAMEAFSRGAKTKILCIRNSNNLLSHIRRCQGVASGATKSGLEYSEIVLEVIKEEEDWLSFLRAAVLDEHPTVDALILTTNLNNNGTMQQQLKQALPLDHAIVVGVFDMSASTTTAINSGDVDFTISQQEPMQGLLPVLLGTLLVTAKTRMNQYWYETGPSIINAAMLPEMICSLGDNLSCLPSTEDPSKSRFPRIGVVTHAAVGDGFWDPVFQGMRQAATDGLAALDTQFANSDFWPSEHVNDAIRNLIATGVDAVMTTRYNPTIAEELNNAGIPFLFFNNFPSEWDYTQYPMYLGYVGQDDHQAGHDLVMHASKGFTPHVLLVARYGDQVWITTRMLGAHAAIEALGGTATELIFNEALGVAGDVSSEEQFQLIKDAMQADGRINLIFTVHASVAVQCTAVAQLLDRSIPIVTFDVAPITVHQVQTGEIAHTVDQVPYAQGFMPVMMASHFLKNRVRIESSMVATGPYFVSPQTVEQAKCQFQVAMGCTWWLCEKGYYYDPNESTCIGCPEGTYQPSALAVGPESCLSCPLGTFNPNSGSPDLAQCVPAPNGTFVNVTGAARSLPCDEGVICGLASTSNIITNITDFNVYNDAKVAKVVVSSKAPFYALIAAAAAVGVFLIVLIFGKHLLNSCWEYIKEQTTTYDKYTAKLRQRRKNDDGTHIIQAPNSFCGGLFTLVLRFALFCYLVYFATSYFTSSVETSSLLPGVAALDDMPISEMAPVPFKVEITAIGGVGECSENSVNVESSYTKEETYTTYQLVANDRCEVSWSVNNLNEDESAVSFTIHSPAEFATAIAWQTSAPSSKAQDQMDSLSGVILPSDISGEVLKGPLANVVSISAYHTTYTDNIEQKYFEGATQQLMSNHTGSTTSSSEFHHQEGLKIQFRFRWSSQFIVYTRSRFQPVGSMIAELTAMFGWVDTALFLATTAVLWRMIYCSGIVLRGRSALEMDQSRQRRALALMGKAMNGTERISGDQVRKSAQLDGLEEALDRASTDEAYAERLSLAIEELREEDPEHGVVAEKDNKSVKSDTEKKDKSILVQPEGSNSSSNVGFTPEGP